MATPSKMSPGSLNYQALPQDPKQILEAIGLDQNFDLNVLYAWYQKNKQKSDLQPILYPLLAVVEKLIMEVTEQQFARITLENQSTKKSEIEMKIVAEFKLVPYDAEFRKTFPEKYFGSCSVPFCDLCHSVMALAASKGHTEGLNLYYKAVESDKLHHALKNATKEPELLEDGEIAGRKRVFDTFEEANNAKRPRKEVGSEVFRKKSFEDLQEEETLPNFIREMKIRRQVRQQNMLKKIDEYTS
jgi:hypothetical protein